MIALTVALDRGLEGIRNDWDLESSEDGSDAAIPLRVFKIRDETVAQSSIDEFHAWRWPPPGDRGPLGNRLGDLGELLGAMALLEGSALQPEDVFPRCLASAGRRVSEAGIDVVAIIMADLHDEPFLAEEWLFLEEAKHTTGSDCSTPLASLSTDVAKTDYQRVRDMLRLLQMQFEVIGRYSFPERASRFMEAHSSMTLCALIDGGLIDALECARRGARRFNDMKTAAGIPIAEVIVVDFPNFEQRVAEIV